MPSSISINLELPGLTFAADAQTPTASLKLLGAAHALVKALADGSPASVSIVAPAAPAPAVEADPHNTRRRATAKA